MIANNNFSWKDYLVNGVQHTIGAITPSIYGVLHVEKEEYIITIYIEWLKWQKDVLNLTICNGE